MQAIQTLVESMWISLIGSKSHNEFDLQARIIKNQSTTMALGKPNTIKVYNQLNL